MIENNILTTEDKSFIADCLMSRARLKARKLRSAEEKRCHPGLIQSLRDDIKECTRIALRLQGIDE